MDKKYYTIRGKRIDDQLDDFELFEQSTYVDLEKNILNFIPQSKKRQHAVDPVQIVKIETLPFLGTKNLNVAAMANSTESNTTYKPSIIFNNVEFEKEDLQSNITFKAKDGADYHIQPLDLAQHTVRVHCTCLDFFWRFRNFNVKDKSSVARSTPPYKPISNRGPVNPQQKPGLCKHLLATFKALKHSGMVR